MGSTPRTLRADSLYDGVAVDQRDVSLLDTEALDRLFDHVFDLYTAVLAGGGGGGGGAPTGASYVTLGTNATLTSERVLTAGAGISLTDAGAGSTVTVALADGDYGDIVVAGGGTVIVIDNDAVTYPQMQQTSAPSVLLGRGSLSGGGTIEEITLGAGLTMTGTTLSAGSSGGSGTAEVDFGAYPGASTATLAITGQAGILTGSLVQAWLYPLDTADHTVDEHRVEEIDVCAGSIVAATGFTIYAKTRNRRLYGAYSVAWRWS